MAKIIIGNVKGKDGRGITKIVKTASTGTVDTYTITYTDNTTSTFTIKNSDEIAIQRQIVPSASIEASNIASQSYTAGQYIVVAGILRKVTSSIAKGNTISDSNSTAITVSESIKNAEDNAAKAASILHNVSKMFVGTVVSKVDTSSTASGNEAILFTKKDFKEKFGREFSPSTDYVGVMNGDGASARAYLHSATFFASGNIWVGVPGVSVGNNVRINYLVVLGEQE